MNKRLQQFIAAENLSQSQFADSIGVARASISHILAGRNKPGFDFIENMARKYPALNLEWLITGKGKMYRGAEQRDDRAPASSGAESAPDLPFDLFSARADQSRRSEDSPAQTPAAPVQTGPYAFSGEPPAAEHKPVEKRSYQVRKGRAITKIVVFYDDNTFQELK